jgi:hypothetical protein
MNKYERTLKTTATIWEYSIRSGLRSRKRTRHGIDRFNRHNFFKKNLFMYGEDDGTIWKEMEEILDAYPGGTKIT